MRQETKIWTDYDIKGGQTNFIVLDEYHPWTSNIIGIIDWSREIN